MQICGQVVVRHYLFVRVCAMNMSLTTHTYPSTFSLRLSSGVVDGRLTPTRSESTLSPHACCVTKHAHDSSDRQGVRTTDGTGVQSIYGMSQSGLCF